MQVTITETCGKSFVDAPAEIQKAFGKQLANLLRDIRYNSLQAKKLDDGRWQARINDNWRLYFRIEEETYVLLDVQEHPK